MPYNILYNNIEGFQFRYMPGKRLFAGLVITKADEDGYLGIYENYIDSVLAKYTEVESRNEDGIAQEVLASCAAIDGLDQVEASNILGAFTTFFLYEFTTGQCIISRNIDFEELDRKAIVPTQNGGIPLVEFDRKKDMGGDGKPADEETDDKEKDDKKEIRIRFDYKSILKRITKIVVFLTCTIVIVYGGKKLYRILTDPSICTLKKRPKEEEKPKFLQDTVNLTVVNELSTHGRLYAEEDSSLIIKYFVTRNMSINENAIDWSQRPLLNRNDTLYPKGNCMVFIRATLRDGNEEAYSQEMAHFDINSYIEQLIMTNSNPQRTKEILSYSFHKPLTICYDNATEDVCEKTTDKGFIDNLRTSLKDGEYHIDSVEFYSNTDIIKDILSNKYPQLKYIGCTSN